LTASKATGLPELMTLRFIAGLGLGAVIPNTMALVGEYAPTKIRVTLMMLTSCGFTAGAAVGGFVSAAIMPRWGWQSVMYVGGAVPFVLAILMIFALPESVQFRAVKNHEPERIRRLLLSVNPLMKIAADASFKTSGPTSASASQLFSDGRATGTLLLWILNFVNMLTLFLLSSWLTTALAAAQYSPAHAVLLSTVLQVGGVAGTIGLARLIDRFSFSTVLPVLFLVGTVSTAAVGYSALTSVDLLAAATIFLCGFCVVGGQPALNALAAVFYPTAVRATGIGCALGMGRLGSILGPLMGGQLIRLNLPVTSLFFYASAAPLIAFLCICTLRRKAAFPSRALTAGALDSQTISQLH